MQKKSTLSFLKDIVVVLIGVLSALFINDWKEKNRTDNYIESMLVTISKDVETSNKEVKETMQRHQEALDSIIYYLEDDSKSIRSIIEQAGGIQYPGIKNVSYRFIDSRNSNLLNYSLISSLDDMSISTNFLNKKFEKLMDFAYKEMEDTLIELYKEYSIKNQDNDK